MNLLAAHTFEHKLHLPGFAAPDLWLGQHLGKPTYRTTAKQASPQTRPVNDMVGQSPIFLYGRLDQSEAGAIARFEACGFRPIDRHVTFRFTGGNKAESATPHVIARDARTEDRGVVIDIARRSFLFSRFHADDAIADDVANDIKAAWAENYFRSERGDGMIVAERDGQVAGFLLFLRNSSGQIIDLIAVSDTYRGMGIGRALVTECKRRLPVGGVLTVGSQEANGPSMKFYDALGFRPIKTEVTLHYHN